MRNSNIIVRRDPFREFDAMVQRAFGPTLGTTVSATRELSGFSPAAESFREGDDAVVRLELPGVTVDDVTLEVVEGKLVVAGERRDERSEETEGRSVREFRYGTFSRAFRLPSRVAAQDVTADFDAGILTVRVAGAYAAPTGQRITINAVSKVSQPVADVEPHAEVEAHTDAETSSES